MTDNLEAYWQRINFFCRMGKLDNWELHFEGFIYIFRLFYQMQKIINSGCIREWHPDFRTWACCQCRLAGNDTKACRMIHQRDEYLRDYILEIS